MFFFVVFLAYVWVFLSGEFVIVFGAFSIGFSYFFQVEVLAARIKMLISGLGLVLE